MPPLSPLARPRRKRSARPRGGVDYTRSLEERAALHALRRSAAALLRGRPCRHFEEVAGDVRLLRFLRQYGEKHALARYAAMLEWREAHGADAARQAIAGGLAPRDFPGRAAIVPKYLPICPLLPGVVASRPLTAERAVLWTGVEAAVDEATWRAWWVHLYVERGAAAAAAAATPAHCYWVLLLLLLLLLLLATAHRPLHTPANDYCPLPRTNSPRLSPLRYEWKQLHLDALADDDEYARAVVVKDATAFSMDNLLQAKTEYGAFTVEAAEHYPDTLVNVHIINAPPGFGLLWGLAKGVLPRTTTSKVLFVNADADDPQAELARAVGPAAAARLVDAASGRARLDDVGWLDWVPAVAAHVPAAAADDAGAEAAAEDAAAPAGVGDALRAAVRPADGEKRGRAHASYRARPLLVVLSAVLLGWFLGSRGERRPPPGHEVPLPAPAPRTALLPVEATLPLDGVVVDERAMAEMAVGEARAAGEPVEVQPYLDSNQLTGA